MIWTFIVIFLVLLSIGMIIAENLNTEIYYADWYDYLMITVIVITTFAVIIWSILMIVSHSGTEKQIIANDMKYESLMYSKSLIDSDYEDLSKTTLIKDITDWNSAVISDRYWSENIWTNWFYNKEVVSKKKLIILMEE